MNSADINFNSHDVWGGGAKNPIYQEPTTINKFDKVLLVIK